MQRFFFVATMQTQAQAPSLTQLNYQLGINALTQLSIPNAHVISWVLLNMHVVCQIHSNSVAQQRKDQLFR